VESKEKFSFSTFIYSMLNEQWFSFLEFIGTELGDFFKGFPKVQSVYILTYIPFSYVFFLTIVLISKHFSYNFFFNDKKNPKILL